MRIFVLSFLLVLFSNALLAQDHEPFFREHPIPQPKLMEAKDSLLQTFGNYKGKLVLKGSHLKQISNGWLSKSSAPQVRERASDTPKLLKDSILYEKYNSSSNQWEIYGRNKYTYDEYGNQTHWIYETTADGIDWVNHSKGISEYNEIGLEIYYERYLWNVSNNEWVNEYKGNDYYDSKGVYIGGEYYKWDNALKEWIGTTKYLIEYEDDLIISEEYYRGWHNESSNWIGRFKLDFVYDDNGNEISEIDYNWDGDTHDWQYSYKIETEYDNPDYPFQSKEFLWENEMWSELFLLKYSHDEDNSLIETLKYSGENLISKVEYNYDEHGNNLSDIRYDRSGDEWMKNSRYDYTYNQGNKVLTQHWYEGKVDTEGNSYWYLRMIVEFAYNERDQVTKYILHVPITLSKESELYESHTSLTEYDVLGNVTLEEQYDWDKTEEKWYGTFKRAQIFDENSNLLSTATYTWDVVNEDWSGTSKYENIFDQHNNRASYKYYSWELGAWRHSSNGYDYYHLDCSNGSSTPALVESSLLDITDECTVSEITAPKAYGCNGELYGTSDIEFPITTTGEMMITWTFDDGIGNLATQEQKVVIDESCVLVAAIDQNESRVIYPNPTLDEFRIADQKTDIKNLIIYNLNGKAVLEFDKRQESYNISKLHRGIYTVALFQTSGERVLEKLVKK